MISYTNIFDQLENEVLTKQLEVHIVNNAVPQIYYFGRAKTGSTCLTYGFENRSVAHWHHRDYFEHIYSNTLLSENKLTLHDFCIYLGNKYGFKPLIIDAIREPISQMTSQILQRVKADRKLTASTVETDEFRNGLTRWIRTSVLNPDLSPVPFCHLEWMDRFGVNLLKDFKWINRYFYKETPNTKLLFLRYEDIADRPAIFAKLGYTYRNGDYNVSAKHAVVGSASLWIKANYSRLGFSEEELSSLYNNPWFQTCYHQDELAAFKRKYLARS